MVILTFVSSTATSFAVAATGTDAAIVLPPRPFEYLNEGAAALEKAKE